MPYRASFDCLWCGSPHLSRAAEDLEGWAQLCPDCLGRAGSNAFLRFRLHRALAERAAEARPAAGRATGARAAAPRPAADQAAGNPAVGDGTASDPAVDDEEDWLLRRGPYAHGPIHDAAWEAELDAAGRWLDDLPIRGRIVHLAPGSGWWAPLLATRGELTVVDDRPVALDRTRERLVAHGLRAHLHERDPWSAPDGPPGDALVVAFRLAGVGPDALVPRLVAARGWLRPGGLCAAIEARPEARSGRADGPAGAVPGLEADALGRALHGAAFAAVEVTTTGRFFALARATS